MKGRLQRIGELWRVGGTSLLLGRALRLVSDELVSLSAPRAFRAFVHDADLERALDITIRVEFQHYEAEVQARQVREEIEALLHRLLRDPPKVVVEIGTAKGGTLFLFTRVAASDATLVSVDLPGSGFGTGYPRRHQRLYRAFARDDQVVRLVQRDSHDPRTAETVRELAGGSLDFLFIDGDHSYLGVRRDYELYAPLVRPGGMIAFHDIVPGDESLVGGVPQFWSELKATHQSASEIVRDWKQGGYGLGVISVSETGAAEH